MSPSSKDLKISEIWSLAAGCATPGWDENDSGSIDRRVLAAATDFIRALPEDIQLPEIATEPDGSISLDWIQSRSRLFSVSVGSTQQLGYAWLNGAAKGHYVSSFEGANVPPRILDGIKDIMGMK